MVQQVCVSLAVAAQGASDFRAAQGTLASMPVPHPFVSRNRVTIERTPEHAGSILAGKAPQGLTKISHGE